MAVAHAVQPFPTLEGAKDIALTTFRRSGAAVATPVWYLVLDGKLYVRTQAGAGKVKRIRHTPRVQLAPSTFRGRPLGPPVEGRARILGPDEARLAAEIETLLQRRYRSARIVWRIVGLRGAGAHHILEIVPAGS